jgi:hypothetical protein
MQQHLALQVLAWKHSASYTRSCQQLPPTFDTRRQCLRCPACGLVACPCGPLPRGVAVLRRTAALAHAQLGALRLCPAAVPAAAALPCSAPAPPAAARAGAVAVAIAAAACTVGPDWERRCRVLLTCRLLSCLPRLWQGPRHGHNGGSKAEPRHHIGPKQRLGRLPRFPCDLLVRRRRQQQEPPRRAAPLRRAARRGLAPRRARRRRQACPRPTPPLTARAPRLPAPAAASARPRAEWPGPRRRRRRRSRGRRAGGCGPARLGRRRGAVCGARGNGKG